MKKSVLTAAKVFTVAILCAVTSNIAAMTTSSPDFIYNITTLQEDVVVKEICKKVGDHYELYSRNEYRFLACGELESLEIAYWNAEAQEWQNSHKIGYDKNLLRNIQTIELTGWNQTTEAFDQIREKAVYPLGESTLQTYNFANN